MDYKSNENDCSYPLATDLTIHRIINGMWQVAGGHGYIDHELAIEDMLKYHEDGFTSWDLADIYGPAEDFVGQFRRRLSEIKGDKELDKIQALTKWVPNPGRIEYSIVKENIQKSLSRMGLDCLDLLQFHWWDYNNPYYLDALEYLSKLRDENIIKHIGLTNFDTDRLQIIIDSGLQIVSNQIQYSIIDRRPEVKMVPFCKAHNVRLLAYGSLCGGLLSERYLKKIQEPSALDLDTLSLKKYKKMIDKWGGWGLFQELLSTLNDIAQKHKVSIANVATRYILQKPAVAGAIIGVRLGISDHRKSNTQVFNFSLDKSDHDTIDTVCSKSNNLFDMVGDCGDEYR
ncbi:MAG TPA: aldo/keto reductase [Candidatus Nitrosocosmicus sp.]|nr:aldo/keto reductase [Candidatus Nitrosocosmicus sp.]